MTSCSPKSSTCCSRIRDSENGHLVGQTARADQRPRRLSAAAAGQAADLDRRRRHAAIGGARRRARPAAGARHHRRRAGALRAAVRALPRGGAPARGHTIRRALATSINVHGFIAETTEQAADDFYGPQAEVMNRIGRERGWGPTTAAHFDQSRGPQRRAVRRRSRDGGREDRRPAQDLRQRPLPAADGDRRRCRTTRS